VFRGAQKAPLQAKRKHKDAVNDRSGKPKTMAALIKRAYDKRLATRKWYANRRALAIIQKIATVKARKEVAEAKYFDSNCFR
jgi:hypothetical protein